MTNEQVLEQQVEALEKLLKLKQAVVEELEKKIATLEARDIFPGIRWPNNPPPLIQPLIQPYTNHCPVDRGFHEYPTMWGGTTPPTCTKCGQAMYPSNSGIVSGTGQGIGGLAGSAGVTIQDGTGLVKTNENK